MIEAIKWLQVAEGISNIQSMSGLGIRLITSVGIRARAGHQLIENI